MKATIIIEGCQGNYSCYMVEELPHCALLGYGNTVEECKKDLLTAYDELQEIGAAEGWQLPELEYEWRMVS